MATPFRSMSRSRRSRSKISRGIGRCTTLPAISMISAPRSSISFGATRGDSAARRRIDSSGSMWACTSMVVTVLMRPPWRFAATLQCLPLGQNVGSHAFPAWSHDGAPKGWHNPAGAITRSARKRMLRLHTGFPLVRCLAFALLAIAALAPVAARAEWPERQITMVVCFPAGGGTDIAARLINTQLGEALGKPVIIENRGGAGGSIGTAAVARAAPDGYTLLVCSSAFVVNPSLYANVTYDPFKDFAPIMVLGASPNAFVVPAQSPVKSMREILDKAKANPGKLNWTSPGAGTTPYLAGEVVKLRTGVDMVHIPFAGAGPATQ